MGSSTHSLILIEGGTIGATNLARKDSKYYPMKVDLIISLDDMRSPTLAKILPRHDPS